MTIIVHDPNTSIDSRENGYVSYYPAFAPHVPGTYPLAMRWNTTIGRDEDWGREEAVELSFHRADICILKILWGKVVAATRTSAVAEMHCRLCVAGRI